MGGRFTNAATVPEADRIARWNGSGWSALGSNGAGNGALTDYVHTLAVSGSDPYVGGAFANAAGIPEADRVAKWDGSGWSALGSDGAGDGAIKTAYPIGALGGLRRGSLRWRLHEGCRGHRGG